MNYFNFNGKIYQASDPVIGPDNRGLRYGDGFFETMKIVNGNILQQADHFERLWQGMRLLQFEIPKLFTPGSLIAAIRILVKKKWP